MYGIVVVSGANGHFHLSEQSFPFGWGSGFFSLLTTIYVYCSLYVTLEPSGQRVSSNVIRWQKTWELKMWWNYECSRFFLHVNPNKCSQKTTCTYFNLWLCLRSHPSKYHTAPFIFVMWQHFQSKKPYTTFSVVERKKHLHRTAYLNGDKIEISWFSLTLIWNLRQKLTI